MGSESVLSDVAVFADAPPHRSCLGDYSRYSDAGAVPCPRKFTTLGDDSPPADRDGLSLCCVYDVLMALRWLHDAREDLWFGCRRLTRDVDATTAVVLVLACGIGLSVAMFAVADTVLRRPLPVLDQERVVVLWGEAGGSMRTLPLTPQHFERFRNEARTLKRLRGR